MRAWAC